MSAPALADVIPPSARRTSMAALLLSLFFAMASNTMVLTGLPQIIRDLDGTPTDHTWIVMTSLLALAVTTPVWGRLRDRFDSKSLLSLSLVLYFAGSVGAGLASEPWLIIGCRVLIGAGAGGIVTLVQLIVTQITTPAERPRFFGAIGAVMSVAAVIAPALGGVIVDLGGWRWTFFSTAPLALIALAMVRRFVPRSPPPATVRGAYDLAGTLLIAATALLTMIWVTMLLPGGLLSVPSIVAASAVVALAAAVVVVERTAEAPLLPLRLFRDAAYARVLLGSVVAGVGAFGTSVYLAVYLQDVRGMSAGAAGLLLLPISAATFAASLGAGRFVSRTGRDKPLLVAGMLAIAAGYLLLATIGLETPLVVVVLGSLLAGAGVGAVTQQIIATGQGLLAPGDLEVGSSVLLFGRSLATVICLSVFGLLVAQASAVSPGAEGYSEGVRTVFAVCLGLAVLGVLALATLRRR
ncbi:MFS transporter [Rathayibacter sp. VKM Ac-2754]|uniref:MFS transporter n=1 Tax=Rathayibacter sp. VKM Ac-2754 TaxID=2609251 RepID=UPI0013574CC4|nr:MFS transporter [Rathayibacter sp. VKM Ac-2754]MWV58940.1 MFS transporter [Rathayibacter sp. VKM Ac-2754]